MGDLLRKAKAIAVKLALPEFEKWIDNELNGYPSGDVPEYRILEGHVKGRNPFHGWQPVHFNDTATERQFSKRRIYDTVAEMESLVANAGGQELLIPLSAEVKSLLREVTGFDFDFGIVVPQSQIVGILDAIRNALLEWSLKLEKLGVKGDGLSFSPDERKKAREAQVVYNIGSIQTLTGNIGSGSGTFTVEGNVVNAESQNAILDFIRRIRSSETQLELEPKSARSLNEALDGLEKEMESRKPAAGRVQGFLASIRNIAEGATGSLVAQGILYELSKYLS